MYLALPGFDRENPQPEYLAADRQLESQTHMRGLEITPESIIIRGNAYFANLETVPGDGRRVSVFRLFADLVGSSSGPVTGWV